LIRTHETSKKFVSNLTAIKRQYLTARRQIERIKLGKHETPNIDENGAFNDEVDFNANPMHLICSMKNNSLLTF